MLKVDLERYHVALRKQRGEPNISYLPLLLEIKVIDFQNKLII